MEFIFVTKNHPLNFPNARIHANNVNTAFDIFKKLCHERIIMGVTIHIFWADENNTYSKTYEVTGELVNNFPEIKLMEKERRK